MTSAILGKVIREKREQLTRVKSSYLSFKTFKEESEETEFSYEPGLLFVLEGKVNYRVGDDEFRTVKTGDFLLYPKGVTITIEAEKESLGALFYLKKEIVEQFIQMLIQYGKRKLELKETNRVCILHQDWSAEIGAVLAETIERVTSLNEDQDFFVVLLLNKLLYFIFPDEHMLSKISYMMETNYYPDPVLNTEGFFLENYHQRIRIQHLLEIAMVSESQLNRLYKKYIGMSPMERLTDIRMEQAAILLRNPAVAIADIAAQVGYQSTSAFLQQFKKKFALSPKEFQKLSSR